MVWLVVLAAALNGKSEVAGLGVPNNTLILAGSTIITGICPLLSCCLFRNKPAAISDVTVVLSAAMLFSLAYWVATFTVSIEHVLETVTGLYLCCLVVPRIISYCCEIMEEGHKERSQDFHTVLDGSHEFLCSMTGIHFLWLESLALEGLNNSKSQGIQHALSETMGIINIMCCAGGLFIMHIGMTPLVTWSKMDDIPGPFGGPDGIMIITIGLVLVLAMWKLLVLQALVLLIVGSLIVGFVCMWHANFPKKDGASSQNIEPPKLAPLGLTKLMVTGFLTVSISVDPTDQLIKWFLVFAAAAILSGLTWRLLTQAQVRKTLENKEKNHFSQSRKDALTFVAFSANTACFFAHTFVAIATVLLMFKTYNTN